MNVRQILTDETSTREEYFAPDYQRLVFETCVLIDTSNPPLPGDHGNSGDDEEGADDQW